nr:MAG TPA: hypothetical protein [Caudoviricetes sp.]
MTTTLIKGTELFDFNKYFNYIIHMSFCQKLYSR